MFVVVDEDVNVHDMNDVIWAITTRTDAARDITIINNTPTDTLDPVSYTHLTLPTTPYV